VVLILEVGNLVAVLVEIQVSLDPAEIQVLLALVENQVCLDSAEIQVLLALVENQVCLGPVEIQVLLALVENQVCLGPVEIQGILGPVEIQVLLALVEIRVFLAPVGIQAYRILAKILALVDTQAFHTHLAPSNIRVLWVRIFLDHHIHQVIVETIVLHQNLLILCLPLKFSPSRRFPLVYATIIGNDWTFRVFKTISNLNSLMYKRGWRWNLV